MIGMIATVLGSKKLELDMYQIVKSHLEFEVREHHGKYAAVERLADGTEIWYTGFPNRTTAEKFIRTRPDSWK